MPVDMAVMVNATVQAIWQCCYHGLGSTPSMDGLFVCQAPEVWVQLQDPAACQYMQVN